MIFSRQGYMTETFKKLKKKYLIIAIIKSVIASVFSALFAVGAVMLGIKLGAVWIPTYAYILIAFGVCAIAFGITFLLTYHTNKSLSKLLDSEYGLNEKVQTMVEFSEQEGDMLKIQREDAEERLKNLPKKKLSFAKIWQYVLIVVLGLSFILSGVLVPSRYVAPSVPSDNNFVLSDWDVKYLDQLILEVKSSDLKEEVMLPTVAALETLKTTLENDVKTKSEMEKVVKACAEAIDTAVILANTYRVIVTRMDEYISLNATADEPYTDFSNFMRSLKNAGDSYQTGGRISSMSLVKSCQKSSEEKIRTALGVFMDAYSAKFTKESKASEANEDNSKVFNSVESVQEEVLAFLVPLTESMVEDGAKIEDLADDELYLALEDLSDYDQLGIVYEDGYFLSHIKSTISSACTNFVSVASKPLVEQVYNRIMDDFIFNRLEDIFSVRLSQDELTLIGGNESGGNGSGEGNNGTGGGEGPGDTQLGSTSKVYDHNTSQQVPYGSDGVWTEYKAKLNELKESCSEEMKAYINKYIAILDGSDKSTSEEGN